jgi:heat shock protein HtpX
MSFRSGLVLSTLALFFALIGFGLFGFEGATVALAIGSIGVAIDLWVSKGLTEHMGAQEITDTKFIWWGRALADRIGVPAPRFYEAASDRPNAATIGVSSTDCSMILFGDIRRRLTRDELAAVIGHELGHIAARDVQARALCGLFVGVTLMLAGSLAVVATLARRSGGVVVLVIAAITGLLALALRMVLSHGQEYAADRAWAELAGPDNMISALQKLHAHANHRVRRISLSRYRLGIACLVGPQSIHWLLSTHPPLHKRIARLQKAGSRRHAVVQDTSWQERRTWEA